eukprot:scaffold3973_cov161-Amphora_coffeaeformis.AAC.17
MTQWIEKDLFVLPVRNREGGKNSAHPDEYRCSKEKHGGFPISNVASFLWELHLRKAPVKHTNSKGRHSTP